MGRFVLVGGVIAAVLVAAACGADNDEPAEPRTIEQVLDEQTPTLLTIDGVVGTGIGECDGSPCIKVFVETATDAVTEEIPNELGGYAVVIEETGPITALEPE